jgi:hypothetical protein
MKQIIHYFSFKLIKNELKTTQAIKYILHFQPFFKKIYSSFFLIKKRKGVTDFF